MADRPKLSLFPKPDEHGPSIEAAPDVKRFNGSWLVYRKVGASIATKVGGSKMPSFRHQSYESAVTEAARLARIFPDSTFLVLQEIARVKMKEAA